MNDFTNIGDKISHMTKEFVQNVLEVLDPNNKDFPSHIHYVGSTVAFPLILALSKVYEVDIGVVTIEHLNCLSSMIKDHKKNA